MLGLDKAMASGTGAIATTFTCEAVNARLFGNAQQGLSMLGRGFVDSPIGLNEINLNHWSA
jgi:hypothetical protein